MFDICIFFKVSVCQIFPDKKKIAALKMNPTSMEEISQEPFSNVPSDKLHPQFLVTIFDKKALLICRCLQYCKFYAES